MIWLKSFGIVIVAVLFLRGLVEIIWNFPDSAFVVLGVLGICGATWWVKKGLEK